MVRVHVQVSDAVFTQRLHAELRLPPLPTKMACRNVFSDRQYSEFRKTSEFISREPWCLTKAAAYIAQLTSDNASGTSTSWMLPELSWFVQAGPACEVTTPQYEIPEEALLPAKPQAIEVHPTAITRTAASASRKKRRHVVAEDVGDPRPPQSARVQADQHKRRVGVPAPDDRLGCSKCRHGRSGCANCRKKKGMLIVDNQWVWPAMLEPEGTAEGAVQRKPAASPRVGEEMLGDDSK